MPNDKIVALGFLTQRDLTVLGPAFKRLWPVDRSSTGFDDLLKAIDEADDQLAKEADAPDRS